MHPDTVVNKYNKLVTPSKIGQLAVRLADEAYFGKDILIKSTVFGCQDKVALDGGKLAELKQKIMSIYPQFLHSPIEFEYYWGKCVAAINHHSAGLRKKLYYTI